MRKLLLLLLCFSAVHGQYMFGLKTALNHADGTFEYDIKKIGNDLNYVISYGYNSTLRINTFSVDPSTYLWTLIDSYQYSNDLWNFDIAVIDATHFIIAYSGADTDGYLKTFSVDVNKDNIATIDALEFDVTNGYLPEIIGIDDTHFLVAYEGVDNNGYLKTFSIDGAYGNITRIDSIRFFVGDLEGNISLEEVASSVFAMSYTNFVPGYFMYLATITVDGAYNITVHDTEFVSNSINSDVQVVNSGGVVVMHEGGDLESFSIDGSYLLTKVDSVRFTTDIDANEGVNSIKHGDNYLLTWRNNSADGFVKSYNVDGSYDITVKDDTWEWTSSTTYQDITLMDDTHLALVYKGSLGKGYVQTLVALSGGFPHTIGGVVTPGKIGGVERIDIIKVGGVE